MDQIKTAVNVAVQKASRGCLYWFAYSAEIALTGHSPSHAPQSMHVSGSITYEESPCEIASVGHAGSHAPQLIHSSLSILYAIEKVTSPFL
jgi:hypothetical protein